MNQPYYESTLGTCVGIISQSIGGRKLCAPTVTDFVHNVGANCVRPKGTLSKRKSLKALNRKLPRADKGIGNRKRSIVISNKCETREK